MTTEPIFELPRQAGTMPLVWGAFALVFLVLAAVVSALRAYRRKP